MIFMKGFTSTGFQTAHQWNFLSTKSFPADMRPGVRDVLSLVFIVALEVAPHTLSNFNIYKTLQTRPSSAWMPIQA